MKLVKFEVLDEKDVHAGFRVRVDHDNSIRITSRNGHDAPVVKPEQFDDLIGILREVAEVIIRSGR